MTGLKAQAKAFLKAKGVKEINTPSGAKIKLANAKTVDVVNVAFKLGF